MNENLKPVKELTPFTKMIMTIGTLPSSFYASMSYYESMVWLYEYLKNQIIPTVNNNGEAVEELQQAFIQLEEWIENYFENLDIQEEINHKLDEMAEDGTLADMIAEYIKMQGQLVYNSVDEMKIAENIQNGSFLKTYGFYNYNDGGGALYKARNITNEDVVDDMFIIALSNENLVAELIIENNILNLKSCGIKSNLSQTEYNNRINIIKTKAYNNSYLVTDDELTLLDDTSLKGLYLDIKTIILNNCSLELGGDRRHYYSGKASYDYDQKIQVIKIIENDTGTVYIRNCMNFKIYIGRAYEINLRTNQIDGAIGYSEFNFMCVENINAGMDITNPDGTTNNGNSEINWINENVFNLHRTYNFTVNVDFDHNEINGGCFEGNVHITLIKGKYNTFNNIRFEIISSYDSLITFSEATANNTIYAERYDYCIRVIDNGLKNKIIFTEALNNTLLCEEHISLNSVLKSIPSNFDVIASGDSSYFTLNRGSSGIKDVWESPFISDPKNIMFELEAVLKNYNALPIFYQIYDGDFNLVNESLLTKNSSIPSLYILTTAKSAYNNVSEGYYVACRPSGGGTSSGVCNSTTDPIADDGSIIDNSKMILYPAFPYWNESEYTSEMYSKMKYVKFVIRAGSWYQTDNTEILALTCKIYRLKPIEFRQHFYTSST